MRQQSRHGSLIERVMRYRKNALLGIYFGLGGLFAGVGLVVFNFRIFADFENQLVLGLGVFIGGYIGIISGCWWLAKAKCWNESIVLIALMPLGILFVPFVRLLILSVPELLPVAMFMMSLILIVVVVALPDKSGVSTRLSWRRMRASGPRSEGTESLAAETERLVSQSGSERNY